MARTLIIIGLVLVAVALLLKLVEAILAVAIPLGALLVIVGIIWHLWARHQRPSG